MEKSCEIWNAGGPDYLPEELPKEVGDIHLSV